MRDHRDYANPNVNIHFAARYLGYKSARRLYEKFKRGEIPGAFKACRQWMIPLTDLEAYMKSRQDAIRKTTQVDIKTEENLCHLAKRKIHPIGIPASRSLVIECRNRRAALLKQKRNDMKINVSAK